jgi:Pyruvate/2-oxoacid:ferredoxin oxidoreductase delta subunit
MVPYVDLVVTEQELDLILRLGDDAASVEQVAEMMDMSLEDTEGFLEKAYHRHVVDREEADDGELRYSPGTFYERLNPMSMYEQWGEVPAEARDAVIKWDMEEFVRVWEPAIREIQADPDAAVMIPNRDFLLLDEALEMVEAAEDHVVVPCDCRAIVKACDRPLDNCVRLDAGALATLEHGLGRRVSKEEMKRIVVEADRAGLMHTGDKDWRENGLYGFCSCCACDCFPIRAARELDLEQAWPRSHYLPVRDLQQCVHCGLCTERCHFEAFYRAEARIEVDGVERRQVAFDVNECWGCGICATACPESAITMVAREDEREGQG